MNILGIETSCDETAIALVKGEGERVTAEKSVVLSQVKKHAKYGGVVPEVAAREHVSALAHMLRNEVPGDGEGIDVIAVTAGPGLAPALRVGVEAAKTLAFCWGKPLVPVNHLEGHVYASWLVTDRTPSSSPLEGGRSAIPEFPALCLIVSGGHTELILMHGHGYFERLGETLDDAAGEAFDKVASMLSLGYPGGPAIAALAEEGDPQRYDFPRGLLNKPNLDFSFSGLKTSVLYMLRENENRLEDEQFKKDVAASFQEAVVDVLVRKTMRAVKKLQPASVVLAGGVAANKELRGRLGEALVSPGANLYLPAFKYTMDNAAMIAAAGYFRAQNENNFINPLDLEADPNLAFKRSQKSQMSQKRRKDI